MIKAISGQFRSILWTQETAENLKMLRAKTEIDGKQKGVKSCSKWEGRVSGPALDFEMKTPTCAFHFRYAIIG